jgi:hypothetical protein
MAIALYMFLNYFLNDYEDKNNVFMNKIYIFLFVFLAHFIFQFFFSLCGTNETTISSLIESAINYSILAIIAFDIYNDMTYNGYFLNYTHKQKILMLILLIVGFMTVIKLIQLLISSN